ncbi:hypothetical protein ZHAS_00019120 [Anopheles sinensis]|uniref:Uncharacterized protein n=1 Tax=Anopheles sinensis TaxID=74873 RepID=A0A084WLH2_ANOSI|nr:hypothetical protein ZHAS_00019120 [Anopheles sinensis]
MHRHQRHPRGRVQLQQVDEGGGVTRRGQKCAAGCRMGRATQVPLSDTLDTLSDHFGETHLVDSFVEEVDARGGGG